MTTALKQRIVGAIFILSLGVILIPVVLDKPLADTAEHEILAHDIPKMPEPPDVSEISKIHYVFDDTPVLEPTLVSPADTDIPSETASTIPPIMASDRPAGPSTDAMQTTLGTPKAPIPAPATTPDNAPAHAITKAPEASPSAGQLKASASLAEAAQSQWTIQLGAFSSEKNAKALVQKLSQGGFNPYLRAITEDSLVRVYVSPGIPREQALDLATKLDTEYGLKGIVVRYFQ